MTNEGKFKKTLNDLIQSKEFEFDEANWEKASGMIDDYRKGNGKRVPYLILSAVVLSIAVLTGLWLLNGSDAASTSKKESQPAQMAATAPVNSPVAENGPRHQHQAPVQEISSVEKSTRPAQQEIIASPATTASKENSSPLEQNTRREKTKKETKTPVLGQGFTEQTTTSPNVGALNPPVSEQPISVANTQDPSEKEKILAQMPAHKATMAPEKEEETSVSEPLMSEKMTAVVSPTAPNETNSSITNTPASTTGETAMVETAIEGTTVASEPPKGVGVYPVLPAADSAMLANTAAVSFEEKEKPLLFSVEAGVSYLYGWKNPGKTDASGYNPFVGLNYFQALMDKVSVSVGIQYTSVSRLSYSSHTTKVSQLGLGEESKITVFTPSKLHYLLLPVRFHYRFSPQHVAGLGCNLAYLLTVETDIETYDQTIKGTGGHTVYKDKGYTEGFRQFDVQMTAFYRRRLTSNLSCHAEIFYGLSDVKNNDFFKSNVFERNSGLKISLVYNIQKR